MHSCTCATFHHLVIILVGSTVGECVADVLVTVGRATGVHRGYFLRTVDCRGSLMFHKV